MKKSLVDTICAVASAPGTGAIAVVRVSGPESFGVVSSVFPNFAKCKERRAVYGELIFDGRVLDDVVAVAYNSPASFTGEDTVELFCHGNPLVASDIIRALSFCGCRMADPGEFTRRAFLNGKVDLTGAEAINSIITARSRFEIDAAIKQMHGSLRSAVAGLRERVIVLKADIECSIDFTDEDIEFVSHNEASTALRGIIEDIVKLRSRCLMGMKLSRGVDLPLVGRPNSGKSSILNMILNAERAIVSDIPGTTRDIIRETIQFGGVHVNLIDTAGIREAENEIERIGILRTSSVIEESSIAVLVIDGTAGYGNEEREIEKLFSGKKIVRLINKSDCVSAEAIHSIIREIQSDAIPFSAHNGDGISVFEEAVTDFIRNEFAGVEESFSADERIILCIDTALANANDSVRLLAEKAPYEIIASAMQGFLDALSDITGEITPDSVLDSIFSRFCIGK